MPYGIAQCYLPPDRGENPAFTPVEAGTRFSDPGGMQGCVDLCYVKADRPGIEPATCKSQVQPPTAEPPRIRGKYNVIHKTRIMNRWFWDLRVGDTLIATLRTSPAGEAKI